ncbi:hypothetical protein RCO27_04825 [Sphingosinicella sp. LHD-64]|uniref:hypothetical protein n=1 Tax=Sphingosinicella sp. LHD-64 TaxID=3072139 RepID=UPI00281054D4|nr:hypothetical protein [Sphingosinicella sp. LHD-64]MDQ8755546.1 hypothetical protein [Sphingosinicella sp. LHD-64]
MRSLAIASLSLAVAACGGSGDADGNASREQIERLSTPEQNKVEDVSETARLQPLQQADAGSLSGASCRFIRENRVYVLASAEGAVARLNDELRTLVPAGPVGPTGGFFEDRQVSISVGAGAAIGSGRVLVTNRRTGVQQQRLGIWNCEGRG